MQIVIVMYVSILYIPTAKCGPPCYVCKHTTHVYHAVIKSQSFLELNVYRWAQCTGVHGHTCTVVYMYTLFFYVATAINAIHSTHE